MLRFSTCNLAALIFLLTVAPAVSSAQGLLVDTNPDNRFRIPRPIIRPRTPTPETSYKIKGLEVDVRLEDQIARVQVSQSFVNTGSRQMEVCFVFPLPYDGAVDRLTFMVDGKEYEAKLLTAGEARRIYESYVRRNRDPALMEWIGTGMFKTSVFPVPPGAERKVTMRYSQICRTNNGLTDFQFPLSTAKYTSHAVEKLSFRLHLQSKAKIKNVYSPTHAVKIQRPDDQRALVEFTAHNQIPTSNFRLFYDIGDRQVEANVISYRPESDEDGYFLLLAGPQIKQEGSKATRKTVVFVVDRSGSMSGKKIEQAKDALRFVFNNLHEGDLFNIVAYDSEVESFRQELQVYDEASRRHALGFIEGIQAGGSTNIGSALQTALGTLKVDKQPSYVIFLTDGLPTTGETNESKLAVHAKEANKVRARMFTFGVGYDVNSRLLDKLARGGYGQSQYVRPNENIEEAVSRLYNRIGLPVMTDIAIRWDLENWKTEYGPLVTRVYPRNAHDLFAGDQLVLAGRYKKHGAAKVSISGKIGGKIEKFDFPAKLIEKSPDETFSFVEKLWAMRRIGEIIDQIDLNGKNDELTNELVSLSSKHGILTPYTSFLADDNVPRDNVRMLRSRASSSLESLGRVGGRGGFSQRAAKNAFQYNAQAPALGLALPATDVSGELTPAGTIQNVGRKTFYQRGDRWIDGSVSTEDEKKVIQLKRYSKEYFDLISQIGKDAAKYLAIEGKVTVKLAGKVYSF